VASAGLTYRCSCAAPIGIRRTPHGFLFDRPAGAFRTTVKEPILGAGPSELLSSAPQDKMHGSGLSTFIQTPANDQRTVTDWRAFKCQNPTSERYFVYRAGAKPMTFPDASGVSVNMLPINDGSAFRCHRHAGSSISQFSEEQSHECRCTAEER
jgi:hypothetical protein